MCCVLSWQGSKEDHLPLVELAYNNIDQANIWKEPYKALMEESVYLHYIGML